LENGAAYDVGRRRHGRAKHDFVVLVCRQSL